MGEAKRRRELAGRGAPWAGLKRYVEDLRDAVHADRGRSFGGSSVDGQPFEEHRRTLVDRV